MGRYRGHVSCLIGYDRLGSPVSESTCHECGEELKKARVKSFMQGCMWGAACIAFWMAESSLGLPFLAVLSGVCFLAMLVKGLAGGEKIWECKACGATFKRA